MTIKPDLHPLIIAGRPDAPHTLDVFMDYVCPYSAKIIATIDTVVKPLVDRGGKYYGKVRVIFRPQVQAWHATSTYTHEAGLAALHAAPDHFYKFALHLFKHQKEFFDEQVLNLTVVQIRQKLVDRATEVLPESAMPRFKELIGIQTCKSSGGVVGGSVGVTDDLKYAIKYGRQNSIHVSPTAMWDGLVENSVSSSWGEVEWKEFFQKKIIV